MGPCACSSLPLTCSLVPFQLVTRRGKMSKAAVHTCWTLKTRWQTKAKCSMKHISSSVIYNNFYHTMESLMEELNQFHVWMRESSPKFVCWKLSSQCSSVGRWNRWEILRMTLELSYEWLRILLDWVFAFLFFFHMGCHCSFCPYLLPTEGTPCLDLGLQSLQNWEKNYYLAWGLC